jgi:hypothetical protein
LKSKSNFQGVGRVAIWKEENTIDEIHEFSKALPTHYI